MKRRQFIKAGTATLSIPFLESLIGSSAWAQTAAVNYKRIVFYNFHNAWYQDLVFPASTQYLIGPEGVRYIPLNQISGNISSLFTTAKYGHLKSKMNLLRGFDLTSASQGGGGHRGLYALGASDERSGNAVKDTIDTVISNSSAFYKSVPFRRVLNAIPVSDGRGSYNFSYQNGQLSNQLKGSKQIFSDFFATATSGTETTSSDPESQRKKALQFGLSAVSELSKSSKISSSDKIKLEAHAEMVNKVIGNLSFSTPSAGTSCSNPNEPTLNESINAASGHSARLKQMMDLTYMAFNCQLTNMAVLQPYFAADGGGFETDDTTGNATYHQTVGHHYDPPEYLKYKGFIMDHLLYLLNLMENTKEANGLSMLDNSLVVVNSNDGCSIHSSWDMPVITFGSLGGLIKTGNYINYQRTNTPSFIGSLDLYNGNDEIGYRKDYTYQLGRPLGSFYVTLLNALGIANSGFGEYSNVDGNYGEFVSAANRVKNLPILI